MPPTATGRRTGRICWRCWTGTARPHPQPEATHFSGPIGRAELKWESHTEFVTYSAFTPGLSARPFDPAEAEVFPEDWLAAAPGKRLASVLIRVEELPDDEADDAGQAGGLVRAGKPCGGRVVDGAAVIAGDFRIDPAGHMRFAVFVRPGTGARPGWPDRAAAVRDRDLPRHVDAGPDAGARPDRAAECAGPDACRRWCRGWTADGRRPRRRCTSLLTISAELESLAVQFSFRFGATGGL